MITENEAKALYPNSVTTKLMYEKFPYSVVLSGKSVSPADLLQFVRERFSFMQDVDCFNCLPLKSSSVSKCGACALHFDSISQIIEKFGIEHVSDISYPLNVTQIDIMKNDQSVRVRDQLFYNTYRYKLEAWVYFTAKRWKPLINFCDNNFENDNILISPKFRAWVEDPDTEYYSDDDRGIFLKNRVDYITLRMVYKNLNMIKIVTHDEVRRLHIERSPESMRHSEAG